MKRLPDSELELMMIIWDAGKPVTRTEIEERLPRERASQSRPRRGRAGGCHGVQRTGQELRLARQGRERT